MKLSALTLATSFACSQAFAPSLSGAGSTTQLDARKPFISGNWKLNPQTKDEAVTLATEISSTITEASPDAEVALFVPYVFIESAMEAVGDKLMIGAEVSCTLVSYSFQPQRDGRMYEELIILTHFL